MNALKSGQAVMCDQAAAESAPMLGAIGNNKEGKIKPDAILIP